MTKPNQIDAKVCGLHPLHGELIAAKDARQAIEHVLSQHKPNTELVAEVTQYCMENNIGQAGETGTKALMEECDRLRKKSDRCDFLHVSPLEKEAVPSLFVASDMSFCTHRMNDNDIAVWCDGPKNALRLIECLEKLTERCRLLERGNN